MLSLLLALFPFLNSSVDEYPIDPVSLRQLCQSAEYIWIGKAGAPVGFGGRQPDSFPDYSKVELEVYQNLRGWDEFPVVKGSGNPSVNIRYWTGSICPTPARFEEGKTYLVFTGREKRGLYESIALSYGVKEVTAEAAEAYAKAIRRWERIGKMVDPKVKKAASIEWVVKLAENPLTRWDGAIELDPDRHLPTGLSKEQWNFSRNDLAPDQRERLLNALAATTQFQRYGDPLYRVYKFDPDPRVTQYLVNYVVNCKSQWIHDDLLQAAIRRADNPKARALFDKYWTTDDGYLHFEGSDTMEKAVVHKIGKILQNWEMLKDEREK